MSDYSSQHTMPEYVPGTYSPNQLYRKLLGVSGLNFADGTDSSSRKQMFAGSHIGQALVVKGATERFIQTGMEAEYAKYTFAKVMPEDARILKVFERYKTTVGFDAIKFPTQRVIVYESMDPNSPYHIGVMDLKNYFSDQTYFGFEYRETAALGEITPRMEIAKDTVLMDSPIRGANNEYAYGVEVNIAYLTLPATAEDGIIMAEDTAKKFRIKTYERREVEWGGRFYPLNLYGNPDDPDDYRPFPDIGDYIRDDGLLMVLRQEDHSLAIVEQSIEALQTVEPHFDRSYYAAGPGGRVVDIRIHHDDYSSNNAPVQFEKQVHKYYNATRDFYKQIIDFNRQLERSPQGRPTLSPEFHALVYEAYVAMGAPQNPNGPNERVQKLFRKNPLDDWRVEFVIEYEITPNIGNKFTECHGGKGVVVEIWPRERMPVDEHGNSADIVMDPNSKISRMNLGGLYEPYINSASRDLLKRIRSKLGVTHTTPALRTKLDVMETTDPELLDEVWSDMLGFMKIISPERVYKWLVTGTYQATRTQFLAQHISHSVNGMHLYMPPENEPEFPDIVRQIEADPRYRPLHGPVTYIGNSGRRVTTVDKCRIGSIYVIMLEKIARDWTAVAAGKLQHFGVLSQITSWDKYSLPYRAQPIRTLGETEIRIYASMAGARVTADLMDRNNNPKTRKFIFKMLLTAANPTNIDRVVDRKVVPYGGAKPLQLIKHMAECGGWRFDYKPYEPLQYERPAVFDLVPH